MSDILRLIAGGLLALVACYVGVQIRRRYRARERFYADAAEYARFVKSELGCAKTPLPIMAARFSENRNGEFVRVLRLSIERLKGRGNEPIDIRFLKPNERAETLDFLLGEGKADLTEQLALADRYAQQFETKRAKCEQESKKQGAMYFKLCVLLGLAVILILA